MTSQDVTAVPFGNEAFSGICGAISIACYMMVSPPQIIKNLRRQSAEGISAAFIGTWLLGDICNISGTLLQDVLPTMVLLAIYFFLADSILFFQCFHYRRMQVTRGGTKALLEPTREGSEDSEDGEEGDGVASAPLLSTQMIELDVLRSYSPDGEAHADPSLTRSDIDLSTTTTTMDTGSPMLGRAESRKNKSVLRTAVSLFLTVLFVCTVGVIAWYVATYYISRSTTGNPDQKNQEPAPPESLSFDPFGQVFGYLSTILYLGALVPQVVLNHRRKSTEGISFKFYLFTNVGGVAFLMSIFLHDPNVKKCPSDQTPCDSAPIPGLYAKYIAINASWIIGALGTLLLGNYVVFQFYLYRRRSLTRSHVLRD